MGGMYRWFSSRLQHLQFGFYTSLWNAFLLLFMYSMQSHGMFYNETTLYSVKEWHEYTISLIKQDNVNAS